MNDDLVKRLRWVEPDAPGERTRWYRNPDGPEAADHIEQLEAALRAAKSSFSTALLWSDDDGTWVAYETVVKAHEIARAALEVETL